MTEPVPFETLFPGESYPSLHQNPNPLPLRVSYTSHSSEAPPWEALARVWLSSLPMSHQPSVAEIDAWIESNRASLPDDLQSVPRLHLHHRILSLHDPSRSLNQVDLSNEAEFPYRFQRTDLWKPVYRWLESLDKDVLVNAKEISEWLAANPEVTERLFSKHSRYHMMHYIQRMHLKLLKKRGKLPKGLQLSAARASVKSVNGGVMTREITLQRKLPNSTRENGTVLHKNKEAFLRYELLTDLQNQLTSVLLKQKHAMNSKNSYPSCLVEQMPGNATTSQSSDKGSKDACCQIVPGDASLNQGVVNIHVTELSKTTILSEIKSGQKRKQSPIIVTPAWSYSEASSEASEIHQPVSSQGEKASKINIWKGDAHSSSLASSYRKSIVMCLQGREKGTSWPSTCCLGGYAGRNQERWISFLQGWRSLGKQFEGPAVWLSRRNCSSWIPTWCAYTSSVAVAQPNDRIQAVEFAARGASIVSCGSNLLKVWDCTTGSCLFNLGLIGGDRASVGHKEKIIAMTVNPWQSCLVVTSGAKGDDKLLLWDALRGELDADLNSNLRTRDQVHPLVVAMEFCSENILVCGSDCEYSGSAIVQLWDIESAESCLSFTANDSYITSLKVNPAGNTIITGAGDGTIGLFDVRTCGAINHLSVGSGFEVTSVSFSNCGTYFTASSTSNNTLVWDTRILPLNHGQIAHDSNDMRFLRPLHCLNHGKQMPTAEYAGQLPGHVDKGNQGVNDSRWLHREPILVTVSGDGSIAMWNVSLGQPCIRHIFGHTRCINTIAVAPNDEYLCTGGDDQKIVLYHNKNGSTGSNWRLSHPLEDI
ncbi:uncharacterized protein LOC135582076 isoform X2 [Musa acuminata AAA Group]|uniref:uncharacterized protein LOC135582076 isoform X2 n=1 Tax=Musa acuminata AAA Group TaxID=214697 RepID=UPI0031DAAFF1